MPICVMDQLPAITTLRNENISVMTSLKDETIQPLQVMLLNLMPKKIETETQFLRLLSYSPLKINVKLLRIDNRTSKHTSNEHINRFYCNFEDVQRNYFDGLIITGAPLGLVDFGDVLFWPQINNILNWAKNHVTSILFMCWAVQAALNILYDIPKMTLKRKLTGIYSHYTINPYSFLTKGFDELFFVPHSRHADFSSEMIRQNTDLEMLSESKDAGAYLFSSQDKRLVFVTGHPEYDRLTLANEYHRDVEHGLNPDIPENYFPEGNTTFRPIVCWRSHGYLLFSNWLHYYIITSKNK